MMPRPYKSKSVIKTAIQLTWENWSAVCEFVPTPWFVRGVWLDENGNPLPEEHWRVGENNDNLGLIIHTLEGEHLARGNDWIIRGLKGEFYPCKPDIFAQSYEPLDDVTLKTAPITEPWLQSVGFKWHEMERSGGKHWCLWLGGALALYEQERTGSPWRFQDDEDLGIELAKSTSEAWHCWFRADTAGRYHRFIHLRYLWTCGELIQIVEALSGAEWNPAHHRYGRLCTPKQIERYKQEDTRLDRQILNSRTKWFDVEKDDTRDRALPEHLEAAEKYRTENPENPKCPSCDAFMVRDEDLKKKLDKDGAHVSAVWVCRKCSQPKATRPQEANLNHA